MMASKPDPEEELFEEMARCARDPLRFVLVAFDWGKGELERYKGPRTWQREELHKLGVRLRAGMGADKAMRLAIVSGNGIGKSAFISWLVLWALSTMPDARCVITANTAKQLENKTWPELLTWHRRSINRDWFISTATALYSADPLRSRTWRADAVSWSETNTEAFAGLHNQGKRLVLIFDEASGIDDRVWDVSEGALTDENTEILWCVFGNYTRNVGRFHECFGKLRHRWHSRQIDSRTVEGIDQALIQEWLKDYGEDHDFFRMRVSAQCPRVGTVQFISTILAQAAAHRPPRVLASDPIAMGVDVARFGEDESVIYIRRGRDARTVPPQRFRGIDAMQLVGHIIHWIGRCGGHVDAIFVDATGVGGPVADRLRQLGYRVIDVNNGASSDCPTNELCANKGAECWSRMREWMAEGAIFDDPDLIGQLSNRQYGFDSHSRIQLERKKDMAKRGVGSPDIADGLALTFAYPLAPRGPDGSRSVVQGRMLSEYDPLAV